MTHWYKWMCLVWHVCDIGTLIHNVIWIWDSMHHINVSHMRHMCDVGTLSGARKFVVWHWDLDSQCDMNLGLNASHECVTHETYVWRWDLVWSKKICWCDFRGLFCKRDLWFYGDYTTYVPTTSGRGIYIRSQLRRMKDSLILVHVTRQSLIRNAIWIWDINKFSCSSTTYGRVIYIRSQLRRMKDSLMYVNTASHGHIKMSHVTHMHELWHTYEWVMAHI